MNWIMTTTTAGPITDIVVYPMIRKSDGPRVRAEKKKLSSEGRMALNAKAMRRNAYLTMTTNFTTADLDVTLTFDDDHLPETRDGVFSAMDRFKRLLSKQRLQRGDILKAMYSVECKHGEGRYHIHAIINRTGDYKQDCEDIRSLWEFGKIVDISTINKKGGYLEVSEYLTKEKPPLGKRAYSRTRNLKKPEKQTVRLASVDWDTLTTPVGHTQLIRNKHENEYGVFFHLRYERPYHWNKREKERPDCYSGAGMIMFKRGI